MKDSLLFIWVEGGSDARFFNADDAPAEVAAVRRAGFAQLSQLYAQRFAKGSALTREVAMQYAARGIRANAILPGLMDTPMSVDTRARVSGRSRSQIAAERDARVPLRHKMGTAWDVANAALFLASDEANHITGVELLVDGGRSLIVGQ